MNNRKKGFTLVELNIASFITLLIFIAAMSLYISAWRNLTIGNTYLDTYAGARNAYGWLARDIRCAGQIVEQYPETGAASYTTNDNVMVLKVPSIHKDTGQIITSYYDYIIYRLEGDNLHRIIKIDTKFNTSGDPYEGKSGRVDSDVSIADHCSSLTFKSGTYGLKHYVDDNTLSTINTVAVYLPINISDTSLGQTTAEMMNPTTIIRLRNK